MKKICKYCGKEYEGKAKQTYCSRDCQRRSKRSAEREHTCANCGKKFSRPKRNRDSCQFCSRDCAFEYRGRDARHKRRINRIRRCEECGKIFLMRGHISAYCSDTCRQVAIERQRCQAIERRFVSETRTCKNCGALFQTVFKGEKSFCSSECRTRYLKEYQRSTKRHRLAGKIVDRDITLSKLSRRDEGICQLCGSPVDWADYIIDDKGSFIAGGNYPSIDHIYPISRGGLHAWDNVQLAHFRCNSIKRDSIA